MIWCDILHFSHPIFIYASWDGFFFIFIYCKCFWFLIINFWVDFIYSFTQKLSHDFMRFFSINWFEFWLTNLLNFILGSLIFDIIYFFHVKCWSRYLKSANSRRTRLFKITSMDIKIKKSKIKTWGVGNKTIRELWTTFP